MIGPVEEALGAPPYVLTIAGNEVPGEAFAALRIRAGRARPDQRPDAARLSVVLATERLDTLPVTGDEVGVEFSAAALTYLGLLDTDPEAVRFTGRVSDLRARATGAVNGPARIELVAVGPRARVVRSTVGGGDYPAELDGARAVRILADAVAEDATLTTAAGDAGTVTVGARLGEAVEAGTLFDRLTVSSGGELVERRDGKLTWHDNDHRHNLAPVLTLGPANVLNESAEAEQGLGGLLNDATVVYGTIGQSEQVVDEISVDPATGYGRMAQTFESDLITATAASSRAFELVGRYSRPRWTLDRLAVDLLRTVDDTLAAALLSAEFGELLRVEGFPLTGPFTSARLFVEGWEESATRDAWRLALSVSEFELTGGSARWADFGGMTKRYIVRKWHERITLASVYIAGGPTWAELATTDPDRSWLGAVGWDVDSGQTDRWADQPSDISWAEEGAVTWAAFTGT